MMASSSSDQDGAYQRLPLDQHGEQDYRNDNDKASDSEDDEVIGRDETYDDDDDYSDDDSAYYPEDDASSWKEFVVWSAWRQHAVAILIAVVAIGCATAFQRSQFLYSTAPRTTHYVSPVYDTSPNNNNDNHKPSRHEHLDGYHRTASISFCGTLTSKVDQQLEMMDFHIDRESIPSVLLHYVADALEDDDYARVLGKPPSQQIPPPNAIRLDDYHCLRQLEDSAEKSYVVGWTYFYQPPSYVDMFPEVAEQEAFALTTENNKRRRAPKPASLTFTGFAAKFINLSPDPVLLHWDGKGGHANAAKLVGTIAPFDSLGTATTPGQSFSVSPVYDTSHALDRWVVTTDDAVVVYEDLSKQDNGWTLMDHQLYQMQLANLEFAKHYLIASHRTWLGQFPRPMPVHPMHPAQYVGQTYPMQVTDGKDRLQELQLQVLSVTPRVLSIDDFLSAAECDALIRMAQAQGMKGSTLYTGGGQQQQYQRDTATRSSTNTWLERDTNEMTDRIYQRAAKLLNMKESLLQQPPYFEEDHDSDAPHHDYMSHSVAESLQVLRYEPGQEYTAHHDFVYPSMRHRYQPTRYATLLLYLNDDFEGGQTNFPRAINPSQHDGLTVTPSKGKAVLFYNMLPDGNVDDLSQHQALPVTQGEKWLANLWIWDPVIN